MEEIGIEMKENGKVIVKGCIGEEKEVIRERNKNVIEIKGKKEYERVMNEVKEVEKKENEKFVDIVKKKGVKIKKRNYEYMKI